jgi:4-hydroxy-3-polyprenylbenzoate decarboxylase
MTRRLVVGISGASGAIYGIRLLEVLRDVEDIETHLVMSAAARQTIVLETDWQLTDVEALADVVYKPGDIAAALSSGSFKTMGMVVVPCSMGTLSDIATSSSDNLLARAADVVLKEHRRLIVVPRETPLHLGHLRLMVQIAEMGAIVCPPVPAFYQRPESIEEIIDHTLNRLIDLLGIELPTDLSRRWEGPDARATRAQRAAARALSEGAGTGPE